MQTVLSAKFSTQDTIAIILIMISLLSPVCFCVFEGLTATTFSYSIMCCSLK